MRIQAKEKIFVPDLKPHFAGAGDGGGGAAGGGGRGEHLSFNELYDHADRKVFGSVEELRAMLRVETDNAAVDI